MRLPGAVLLISMLAGSALAQVPASPPPLLVSPEVHADGRVTLRLRAPGAREAVVTSEWGAPMPMVKDAQGVWSLTTAPLEPDLYGYSFVVDGVIQFDPSNPAAPIPNLVEAASMLHVPGAEPRPWEEQAVPRGAVHQHFHHSAVVGDERDFFVYTPPGYDPRAATPYPVLYLLHGWSDDARAWTWVGRAHVILDNLIASGKARPMVVVMPLGYGAPEIVSRFLPMYDPALRRRNTDRFRQVLLTEVMPLVESLYRVATDREQRAVAGLSMGGAQALDLGLNANDRFAWVGAFSSALSDDLEASFPGLGTPARPPLHLLWLACGRDDTWAPVNRRFQQLLAARGVPFTPSWTPGAHAWPVWRRNLVDLAPRLFRQATTE